MIVYGGTKSETTGGHIGPNGGGGGRQFNGMLIDSWPELAVRAGQKRKASKKIQAINRTRDGQQ